MKVRNGIVVAVLILAYAGTALAEISHEEARKLGGPVLTEVGAERAGSKDGMIPPYTGGITKMPAGFKEGSGSYVDPYANEKPLFTITKANMSKYADKLTEGEKALLMHKPGYRMDIYPTHRSVNFPEYVRKGTIKAATTAKMSKDGNSFTGAVSGYPFPIPKTGAEAIWNHLLHYQGEATDPVNCSIYFVDAAGRSSLVNKGTYISEFPYWYKKNPKPNPYVLNRGDVDGPPRLAGQNYMSKYNTDGEVKAWMYMVGQRRVRTAPDLTYDSPSPVFAGSITCDDSYVLIGAIDRFNWKLIGKKEMYVPYNDFKLVFDSTPQTLLNPKFVNPDYVRWELHRVWVVEATVKPGRRHLYKKRTFYLDEDSWAGVASDDYDGKMQLYRTVFSYLIPGYDKGTVSTYTYTGYDLIAGGYGIGVLPFKPDGKLFFRGPLPKKMWSPEDLANSVH